MKDTLFRLGVILLARFGIMTLIFYLWSESLSWARYIGLVMLLAFSGMLLDASIF